MEQQSLYERLGGVNAIAMVVDRFSDAIIENPKLQKNPALREWNESGQLAGQIDRALHYFNVPQPERQEFLAASSQGRTR